MKFYRYCKTPNGDKRFSSYSFSTEEVKQFLLENNSRYYFLPTYQDRSPLRIIYYPCKPIETIQQLEEFVNPNKYTFVLDQEKWKLKIHTPEQLMSFYDNYVFPSMILENLENIEKSTLNLDLSSTDYINWDLSNLKELKEPDSYNIYQIGIFQGKLMAFQMFQIEKTGGILISENFEYDFLESPHEHFDKEYVSDILEFPTNEQTLDDIDNKLNDMNKNTEKIIDQQTHNNLEEIAEFDYEGDDL